MDNCPKCNALFIGEPIPKEDRDKYYGGKTHFRREIGIDGEMLGIYDGIIAHRCPDCKHEFAISNHPLYVNMFEAYKKKVKEV